MLKGDLFAWMSVGTTFLNIRSAFNCWGRIGGSGIGFALRKVAAVGSDLEEPMSLNAPETLVLMKCSSIEGMKVDRCTDER